MKISQLWSERKRILLLGLLIALLLVLWARQADLIPPSPAGRVVRMLFHPVVASVAAVDRVITRVWTVAIESVRGAKNLEAENRELKRELALVRAHAQRLEESYAALQRLTNLAAGQPSFARFPHVVANIIEVSTNFWTRNVIVDRGRPDGIAPGMPVVNQDGLVGVVRHVTDFDATVQLLIDREFAAGALTSETRVRGVIEGTGEIDRLRLILENPETPLQLGFTVITSGLPVEHSLFPKGFIVGTIESIGENRFGQPVGLVRPIVRYDRLEEVVVLLEKQRTEIPPQQLPEPP